MQRNLWCWVRGYTTTKGVVRLPPTTTDNLAEQLLHAADEHGHGRHELDHSALLTLAADAIAAAKESEAATRVLDELNANDILPAIGKARVLQLCRPSAAQRTSRVAAIRVFDV